jgi:hypothetical protein
VNAILSRDLTDVMHILLLTHACVIFMFGHLKVT